MCNGNVIYILLSWDLSVSYGEHFFYLLAQGMIAGHAYYFLEDVYPRMTSRRPLRTPAFIRSLFAEEPVVAARPAAVRFAAPPVVDARWNVRSWGVWASECWAVFQLARGSIWDPLSIVLMTLVVSSYRPTVSKLALTVKMHPLCWVLKDTTLLIKTIKYWGVFTDWLQSSNFIALPPFSACLVNNLVGEKKWSLIW